MKIYNGTENDVNIIADAKFDPSISAYVGNVITRTLSRNGILNARVSGFGRSELFEECFLDMSEELVPVFDRATFNYDPLPKGYDVYIVSVPYAMAYTAEESQNGKIFTLADPVISADGGSLLGHRGISLFPG